MRNSALNEGEQIQAVLWLEENEKEDLRHIVGPLNVVTRKALLI